MSAATTPRNPAATQVLPAGSAPSRNYLPALAVYVVWHPKNSRGSELARSLFDRLTSDSKAPLARGIGIPVYFRTGTSGAPVPLPIDLKQASHTAVIMLVDEEMVRDRRQGWSAYVEGIWTETNRNEGEHRMLPVALARSAFGFFPAIGEANFIRFYQADKEKQVVELTINVVHELSRLLLRERRADHENPGAATVNGRVKVFISHAKGDGLAIAKAINSFIRNDTQLVTFFDSNEIMYGDVFPTVIRDEAARCAMLIVQTDTYGTRYWCQEEVLLAKAEKRPVLILDAIERGEARSFPYLNNGPKVRCSGAAGLVIEPIVAQLLLEVLRVKHATRQFEVLRDLFNIPQGEGIEFLPYPPELLTLAEIRLREKADAEKLQGTERKPTRTVVYPDPPLGLNEMRRLRVFAEGLRLVTSTLLLTEGQRRAAVSDGGASAAEPQPTEEQGKATAEAAAELVKDESEADGWQVGLSLSDVPEDHLLALGLGPEHLTRTTVEFSRYMLAAGHHLAYGGDLRGGGFTEIIHDLVKTYNDENHGPKEVLVNYLAWYIHKSATAEEMNRYHEAAGQILVGLPADLSRFEGGSPDVNSPDFLYIRARALTKMREEMNEQIKARVILGGRLVGYGGTYPGVVEEAAIAISKNKPLYLIGRFGGCARAIIEAIEGGCAPLLMSSLKDVSLIPTNGKNLIVVATVADVLHFRVFDLDGKVLTDKNEKELTEHAEQIEDFRQQVRSLWPPHVLTWIERDSVITTVASIVGLDPKALTDVSHTPEALTEEYQVDAMRNPGYAARVADYNKRAAEGIAVDPIDYNKLVDRFNKYKVKGLSAHNGLSEEENRKLFDTADIEEMVYLVLKGLLEVRRKSGRLS